MIEASLLIFLSLLVVALSVWNIMVHHWLSRGRAREAAHGAQIDATLQGLARRLSDVEEVLGAVSADGQTMQGGDAKMPLLPAASEETPEEDAQVSKPLRPAEAELLAKLALYRKRLERPESTSGGVAEAV